MPCDTIQTNQVEFNLEHTDINLLKAALESLGFNVRQPSNGRLVFYNSSSSGSFHDGLLDTQSSFGEFDVNAVKRAYSEQIIKATSKRFGWDLKKKPNVECVFVTGKKF